jgi:CRISPR-associated protein Csx10
MQRIQLIVTAKSALAIGRQKTGSSISDVETYIPGTVLRGSIAGMMIRQAQAEGQDFANDAESDFKTLFIDNQAIFQNLYPALTDELAIHHDVRQIPATALSSKNDSGFKPKKNGAFDSLIDRFCADAYGQIYDPNCPTDNGRVDAFKGLYSVVNGKYHSHAASTRLLTRVGINRRRATAEDKVLYSLQVLNETKRNKQTQAIAEMAFAGSIWVCDELAQSFSTYLQQQSQHLRIGGATSRGLGKIEIRQVEPPPQTPIAKRVDQFNQKLKQRWQQWSNIFGQPTLDLNLQNRCFFTLDLQSDAILIDRWLRTTVISEKMLQETTGVSVGNLQLHAAYSSYGHRSGWNTAWGLPKDVELTTDRGSVYLFSVDEGDRSAWIAALDTLEIWGIGKATAEGFGQVRVCDQFHNVLREDAV